MKFKIVLGTMMTSLLLVGLTSTMWAQNAPANNRRGYSGPPKTEQERAARQAACLEKNGGVCPNGGLRANCPGAGAGNKGQGKGLRDGTGPRSQNNTCPLTAPASGAK